MAPRKKKQESESKSRVKPRVRVSLADSLLTAVTKLAYGNANSGAILSRIVMKMVHNDAIEFLHTASELELYGSDIEYAYSTYCNGDSDWFVASVCTRDSNMLRDVEKQKVAKLAKTLGIQI